MDEEGCTRQDDGYYSSGYITNTYRSCSSALSAGVIAVISIGCVLIAAAEMIACVLWYRRKKGDSATATISSDGGGAAAEEKGELTGSGLSWKPMLKQMKRVNV